MMVNPEYVLFLCQTERIILNKSLIGISCHHIMSYIKVIGMLLRIYHTCRLALQTLLRIVVF